MYLMKYINDRQDLIKIVDTFYNKVKTDDTLGYIFNDVMKVNWDKHLTKMYDFWENILFQTGNYNGRPFPVHLQVNDKKNLGDAEFNRWLQVFIDTVNELFQGANATELKQKAMNIQVVWKTKFNYINNAGNPHMLP